LATSNTQGINRDDFSSQPLLQPLGPNNATISAADLIESNPRTRNLGDFTSIEST